VFVEGGAEKLVFRNPVAPENQIVIGRVIIDALFDGLHRYDFLMMMLLFSKFVRRDFIADARICHSGSPREEYFVVMDEDARHYRVVHRTHYVYTHESSLCHNQLHLKPRDLPEQTLQSSWIAIEPAPACRHAWIDTFGNHVEFFSIEQIHPELTITSRCRIARHKSKPPTSSGMPWTTLAESMDSMRDIDQLAASEFLFDSRYGIRSPQFEIYARSKIDPSMDTVEACVHLMNEVHSDFKYDPDSTHVATSPLEVLDKRRGVCQDFAHVLICSLRSIGIPARYVSGYLLTRPAPGKEKLVGADASHAWVSAYVGPAGWLDLDPTNNMIPGWEHLTVAWGRDYADVAPVQGVYVGGGFASLEVAVDVMLAKETDPD
jgi:transglutaminase-like putative cysteine protease